MAIKKVEVEIDWTDQSEFPGVLGENGFSIDVLVYCKKLDLHTIGWFEYKTHKWHFLCCEQHIEKFEWRYFNKLIDKT